jgi:hypothetical protein
MAPRMAPARPTRNRIGRSHLAVDWVVVFSIGYLAYIMGVVSSRDHFSAERYGRIEVLPLLPRRFVGYNEPMGYTVTYRINNHDLVDPIRQLTWRRRRNRYCSWARRATSSGKRSFSNGWPPVDHVVQGVDVGLAIGFPLAGLAGKT